MDHCRIFFPGNPWPEGHPIKTFEWKACVKNGEVCFDFRLQSEEFDAERPINEEDYAEEYPSDWEAPAVWKNFHACTLSTNPFLEGGFPTGLSELSTADALDGLELVLDHPPTDNHYDNAFHLYLLGHDAVGDHRIRFSRVAGTDRFNIDWTGKVALAYLGDDEFRYEFVASLVDVESPRLPV